MWSHTYLGIHPPSVQPRGPGTVPRGHSGRGAHDGVGQEEQEVPHVSPHAAELHGGGSGLAPDADLAAGPGHLPAVRPRPEEAGLPGQLPQPGAAAGLEPVCGGAGDGGVNQGDTCDDGRQPDLLVTYVWGW